MGGLCTPFGTDSPGLVPSPCMDRFSFRSRSSSTLPHDETQNSVPEPPESRLSEATQTDNLSRTPTPHANNSFGDDAASGSTDSTRIGILSFHFGSEFLSRPIDLCALPSGNLVISDSCGGVYITTRKGDVVQQVSVDGGSASSLCYNQHFDQLFVSVMQRSGRSVYVFDGNFQLKTKVPCPSEPKIDISRTRWIACNPRGHLYMASGDNKKSAVWSYDGMRDRWTVLKEQKYARYQYLEVAEDRPEQDSVVLLLSEAVNASLLLLVVAKNGSIWSEFDLTKQYKLNDYLRSPASSVVDEFGNLLVLDYANGKLWALLRASEGVRRLRVLAEIGPQQGLGMVASNRWCFVACFNKKRVQAINYLESE